MASFVSLTRLRIRSVRFLPLFALHTFRSLRQVRSAPGFCVGAILADRERTFWTMTAWESREHMRAYMVAGPHARVMPSLLHWCDEASVAHWSQTDASLPSWSDADARMRTMGRPSKVLHPTAAHASLSYRTPRTQYSGPIRAAGRARG